jgi:two-component system KDP operon response regulator KdpE
MGNVPVKILVVDDDSATVKFIAANLEANGYETLKAYNGEEALKVIDKESPDMVILDIMMPVMDGYETCRRLREWSQIPVIMLSARQNEEDKVKCLNMGADDYMCKPFGLDEMIARIQAVLRRNDTINTTNLTGSVFTSGELRINLIERRVTVDGKEVPLTYMEYSILREFVLNSPKVLTYQMLLQKVWGTEYHDEKGYLYVFIRRLRKKLEQDPKNPRHILSMRDVGYRLV